MSQPTPTFVGWDSCQCNEPPVSLHGLLVMDPSKFVAPGMGKLVRAIGPDGPYWTFVPASIPRSLSLAPQTLMVLSRADTALGRLAGAGRLLVPQGDVKEVQNYVRALTQGLDLLPELPLPVV